MSEMLVMREAGYSAVGLVMGSTFYNMAVTVVLQAEGIVAAEIHEGNHSWSPNVIEFFSIGTAVAAISADHHIPTPQLVLSVDR